MDFYSVLSIPHLDTHNDPTDGTSISYLWQGYHIGHHSTRAALSQPVCKQLDAFFKDISNGNMTAHSKQSCPSQWSFNLTSIIFNCDISSLITLSTRSHRLRILPWKKSNTSKLPSPIHCVHWTASSSLTVRFNLHHEESTQPFSAPGPSVSVQHDIMLL